jgi:cholesterol oxidase
MTRLWAVSQYETGEQVNEPTRRAIRIRDRMTGWVAEAAHISDDYREAELWGKLNGWTFSQKLKITADDSQRLVHDHGYAGRLSGHIRWPRVSNEPLRVEDGRYILFQDDSEDVGRVHMRYEMRFIDPGGNSYFFVGVKNLHLRWGDILDLWSQTTTLYVTIFGGESDDEEKVIARGILRISVFGVLRMLLSIHSPNAASRKASRRVAFRFGAAFITEIYRIYGGFGATPRLETREEEGPGIGCGGTEEDVALRGEPHSFLTDDDMRLRLTRYNGGSKGPVILTHGLGTSSNIFSTQAIDSNLLRCLYDDGFDVWLLDYRTSTLLPSSTMPSSGDDIARHDYPSAVDEVLRLTGACSVQMVAHCFGATTFVMAMLYGQNEIDKKVRSAVISQIATNVIAPWPTRLKAALHAPDIFARLKIGYVNSRASRQEAWYDRLFDWALGLTTYPAGPEQCSSADCHRISFLYGLLYQHSKLNTATHERGLASMFGPANVRAFRHLCEMIRHKEIVSMEDSFNYMGHLDRLNIPITFIHGARNRCYLPKSTELTVNLLEEENGVGLYERYVIPDYGHIDCIFGREANNDVYPYVSAALNRYSAAPS